MDEKLRFSNLIGAVLCLSAVLVLFSGCKKTGDSNENPAFTTRQPSVLAQKEEPAPEVEEAAIEEKLYIVEAVDTSQETIVVYSINTNRELRFSYNLTTAFMDKYGNRLNSLNFSPGSVVAFGDLLPESGALSKVQMATTVWNYNDLSRYDINLDEGIFEIAGTKYRITDDTRAYSGNTNIELVDISKEDVLSVTGIDKEILSVSVTTGHGYVELVNTELFEDSLIFIGPKIATVIYGDDLLQVPEGTYEITVANDGWGGSGEYTVVRNETTVVDLDKIKGEGPKYCELTFEVLIPSCSIYLDGFRVDPEEVQEVRYGTHSLKVMAEGYDTWNKTLVVNSSSATISLDLTAESQKTESVSTEGNGSSVTLDNDSINKLAEALKGQDSTSSNNSELDYLTTLSNTISTLMN